MDGSKRNASKNYSDEQERCYAASKFPKFRNRIYSASSVSSRKVCYIKEDYKVIHAENYIYTLKRSFFQTPL